MTEKEFDYVQMGSLSDARPFIAPGMISWLQGQADPVHITFLSEMPGVEGAQGIPTSEVAMSVIGTKDGKLDVVGVENVKTVVFNFGMSAISNFFTNDKGIGCMMRFGTVARSVFIPFTAMLNVYAPKGVENAAVFGFHPDVPAMNLCQALTPGMFQALKGTAPAPADSPAPAPVEEAVSKPSFLTRVK